MEKMTKPQQAAYDEIKAKGGVVKSSDWTTGTGRYITRRAIPPNCERFERGSKDITVAAKSFFEANPRVVAVIACIE